MKMVINFSCDYVIMKFDFWVCYDVDVEKICKIIKKKVYQFIQDDFELGFKLMELIKFQGVCEMDDLVMIMWVKYKIKFGDQFVICKEVYWLMQEVFREVGIEFVYCNVIVYLLFDSGGQVVGKVVEGVW